MALALRIIGKSCCFVSEHAISFIDRFHLFGATTAIWMMALGETFIEPFNLSLRRVFRGAQNNIIIFLTIKKAHFCCSEYQRLRDGPFGPGDRLVFDRPAPLFLAVFCHASVITSPSMSSSTESNLTRVQPARPHAPLSGTNVAGFCRTNFCCWSGVSFT